MRVISTTFILLLLVTAHSANAGLIQAGIEWEIRGTPAPHASQAIQASLDLGWTWASESDFNAAGFFTSNIGPPDWSALMGDLDGFPVFPNAWLSDPVNLLGFGRVVLAQAQADALSGQYSPAAANSSSNPHHRLSFRQVPEPSTMALLALSLGGVVWSRRKTGQ